MDLDQPPVVEVTVDPDRRLDPEAWPRRVPAAAQLEGLRLDPGWSCSEPQRHLRHLLDD